MQNESDRENLAASERKSSESSNEDASHYGVFQPTLGPNLGKRSPVGSLMRVLRDQSNVNVPRPNGFFFPSTAKRALGRHFPKNWDFYLPHHKRSQNLPNIVRMGANDWRMDKRRQNWPTALDDSMDWSPWKRSPLDKEMATPFDTPWKRFFKPRLI